MKTFLFLIKCFFLLSNISADGCCVSCDHLLYQKQVKNIFIFDFCSFQYLNKSIRIVYGIAINDIFHSVFLNLYSFRVGLYVNNLPYINIYCNVLLKFFKFKYFAVSVGSVNFRSITLSIFINYNRISCGYIKSFNFVKEKKTNDKIDLQVEQECNDDLKEFEKSEELSKSSEESITVLEHTLTSVKTLSHSLYLKNINIFYTNVQCSFKELNNFIKYQLTMNVIDLRNDIITLSDNYTQDAFYSMLKEFCSSSNKLFSYSLNERNMLNNNYYNLDCSNFISDVYLKNLYINNQNFRQNLSKICLYKKAFNDNLSRCISSFCYIIENCVDLQNLEKTKIKFEDLISNLDKILNVNNCTFISDDSFYDIFFDKIVLGKNEIKLNQNLIKNEEKNLLCDIYTEIYLYFIRQLNNPYEKNNKMFDLKLFSFDRLNIKNQNFTFNEYKIKTFNMKVCELFSQLCKKINSELYLNIMLNVEESSITNISNVVKFLFIKNSEFEEAEVIEIENYIENIVKEYENSQNILKNKSSSKRFYIDASLRVSIYRIKLYILKKLCLKFKFRSIILKLLQEEMDKLDFVNLEVFNTVNFYVHKDGEFKCYNAKKVPISYKSDETVTFVDKIGKISTQHIYYSIKSLFYSLLTSNNGKIFNKRKIFLIKILNQMKEAYINIPKEKYLNYIESLYPSIITWMKEDQLIFHSKNDVAQVKSSFASYSLIKQNNLDQLSINIEKHFKFATKSINLFCYLKDMSEIKYEINSQDIDYPKFLSKALKIFVRYLKKYENIYGKLPNVKNINKNDRNIIDAYLHLSNMMHESIYYYLAYQMICDNEFLQSKLMGSKECDDYYYSCDKEDMKRVKRKFFISNLILVDKDANANLKNVCFDDVYCDFANIRNIYFRDFYQQKYFISCDLLKKENYTDDINKFNYISSCVDINFKDIEIEVKNSLFTSNVPISDVFIKEMKDVLSQNVLFNLEKKDQSFVLKVNAMPLIHSDLYENIYDFWAAKTVYKLNNESKNDRLGYQQLIYETFSNKEKLKLILPKKQEELNYQLPGYLIDSLNVHSKRIENIFNLYVSQELLFPFICLVFTLLQNNLKYIVKMDNNYSQDFFDKVECNLIKMKEELSMLLNDKKITNLSSESKDFVNNTKRKFDVYNKMFEALKIIDNQHSEEFSKLLLQFMHYMPLGFKDEFIFDFYLHNVGNENARPYNKFENCMRNF